MVLRTQFDVVSLAENKVRDAKKALGFLAVIVIHKKI
jgi:hypothetical protein